MTTRHASIASQPGQPNAAVPERAILAAVFFVSLAILLHEILLTRIFSVTLWYHFAFMAISIAMFGMTAGAIAVFARADLFTPDQVCSRLGSAALLFAATVVVSLIIQLNLPQSFNGQNWHPLTFAATYVVVSVPYFFGGVFIAAALTKLPMNVSRLYAADLAGAAIGCGTLVWLMKVVDGVTAVLVVAAVGSLAAALVGAAPQATRYRALGSIAAAVVLALAAFNVVGARVGAAPLRLVWVKGQLESPALFERWNSYSRVVVRGDTVVPRHPSGWGLSPRLHTPRIGQLSLDIDAGAGTVLTRYSGDPSQLTHLRGDISNVAHHLRSNADVFVVGVGGGRDVLSALAFEQKSVLGVEVNDAIIDMVNDRFGNFTGHLGRDPRVTLVNDEARSYLARSSARFDIIQISMIDTWAATSAGAFVFTENGLYTREAWNIFLEHLHPQGILSVTRWYSLGFPGEIYRLAVLAATALRDRRIERPADHIMLVRLMLEKPGAAVPDGVGTMLISTDPFTSEDRDRIRQAATAMGFEVVLSGDHAIDPVLASIIHDDNLDDRLRSFPLNISAPTDDDPFFFQMLRPRQILRSDSSIRQRGLEFNTQAMRVLGALLITVVVLTTICILLPLALKRRRARPAGTGPLLWYFAAIGLGFMFIEISQLQRLNIFLGHPVYGTSVALFALLLSSGMGSFASRHIQGSDIRGALSRLTALLAVLAVSGLLGPAILDQFAAAPTTLRVSIGVVLLFPMGFLMGMAFPLGLKLASMRWGDGGPWLWGINGATSVLASVLAVALSITFSISTVFWLGAACYALAIATFALMAFQGTSAKFTSAVRDL